MTIQEFKLEIYKALGEAAMCREDDMVDIDAIKEIGDRLGNDLDSILHDVLMIKDLHV